MTRIAINGFGRIGRHVFKILLEKKGLEVVAINDLTDIPTLAHLLKYDSSYGIYNQKVEIEPDGILVNDKKIKVLANKEVEKLPWKEYGVDIVLECTGIYTDYEKAKAHLEAGAKKVIISANSKSKEVKSLVLGVNEEEYNEKEHDIVANNSCTTNCLAPVVSVIHKNLRVKNGLMTTVHSYTTSQKLQDSPHKNLREARAACLNIIPTETGAARAVATVIPDLKGKIDGLAYRVPTPTVSVAEFVCQVEEATNREKVDKIFIEAAKSDKLKGILGVSLIPLVSMDYKGSPYSAIVDLPLTMVIEGNLVKVVAWYDNEWGYATRLAEMTEYIAKKL